MTAAPYLARLRAAAERQMLSACRIDHRDEVSLDTATLDLTDLDPSDDLVYAGPCRVSSNSSAVTPNDAGGQLITEQQLVLSIPVGAAGLVRVRDEVTITDGGPDPQLTGRKFRIVGIPSATAATARRFPVEQTSTEDA